MPGSLPIAIAFTSRRIQPAERSPIESMIGSEDVPTSTRGLATTVRLKYKNDEVVALCHNYKKHKTPYFLALLQSDIMVNMHGMFVDKHMKILWLNEVETLLYEEWGTVT